MDLNVDNVAMMELLIDGMDVNNLYLVSHGADAAGVWIPPEFAESLKNYAIFLFENELLKESDKQEELSF